LLAEQDRLLIDIFNGWDATTPPPDVDNTSTVVPESESSRFRNATVGHAIAVGAGLAALFCFGLLHHPSPSTTGAPSFTQAAAAAVAAGVTMAVLELAGSHHAPAAATAVLVATSRAAPGTSETMTA
jgi:hypothetical protein